MLGYCMVLVLPTIVHARQPAVARTSSAPAPTQTSATPPQALNDEQLQRDTPPDSPYDVGAASLPLVPPEDHALIAVVGRTLLALALVLTLIYFLAKVVLPRFTDSRRRIGISQLRVLDRLALDKIHAVVLLELEDGGRLLVGTGGGSVQLLQSFARPQGASFAASLQDAPKAQSAVPSLPREPHADHP